VQEVVRFDPVAAEGQRLRVWDRVRADLVERRVEGDRTACVVLDHHWTVCPVAGQPVGLRLVDDDGRLLETAEEAETKARAEADARAAAAEARVRELEAELARRPS
jgi:hypothetical protein